MQTKKEKTLYCILLSVIATILPLTVIEDGLGGSGSISSREHAAEPPVAPLRDRDGEAGPGEDDPLLLLPGGLGTGLV